MPTATSLSGFSLINDGPLTTTFTAPASCSTAYGIAIAESSVPNLAIFDAQCDWVPPAGCNPFGSVIRSLDSAAVNGNPAADMTILYNSPGLACPFGWATVGTAAKLNPTSTSISGAFNAPFPPFSVPADVKIILNAPSLDLFMTALDPGETAALCCPRFAYLFPNPAHTHLPVTRELTQVL